MNRASWSPGHPLDFDRWRARHTRHGPDPRNVVAEGWLYHVAGDLPYRTRFEEGVVIVETEGDPEVAVDHVRFRLAEHLDPEPLVSLAERDERVADLARRFPGVRPPLTADGFEALITSVTAQQVNLRWALTTRRRLVEAVGRRQELDGVDVWAFPRADRVAEMPVADLRAMQFTNAKAEYIIAIARSCAEGWLEGIESFSNDAIVEYLTVHRGVGRWTADWFLARSLGRPDAVAAGDLGVRKAVSFLYRSSDHILDEDVVRDTASAWGDATNHTVHLLLETLT